MLTEPMLKKVEAKAGTAKRLQALSTPIAWAASATSKRNGNITRVIFTASSNLPGTWRYPSAIRWTRTGLKITPKIQNEPTSKISAVATRFDKTAASLRPFWAKVCVKMGTKADESAPSANRSRVRFGIRKPSRKAS